MLIFAGKEPETGAKNMCREKGMQEKQREKKMERKKMKENICYFAVILSVFGLDMHLKNRIEKNGTEGTDREKLGGFLLIRKHHNRGAFLNMGQHRRKVVALISVLLTASLTVLFALTLGHAGKGLLKWGLTLLLGGAYSNTYDRLVRKYVVDYVSFNVPFGLKKVIFNVGDFCIMIGALLSTIGSMAEL